MINSSRSLIMLCTMIACLIICYYMFTYNHDEPAVGDCWRRLCLLCNLSVVLHKPSRAIWDSSLGQTTWGHVPLPSMRRWRVRWWEGRGDSGVIPTIDQYYFSFRLLSEELIIFQQFEWRMCFAWYTLIKKIHELFDELLFCFEWARGVTGWLSG